MVVLHPFSCAFPLRSAELIDEIVAEIKTMDFGKMRLKIYVFSPGRQVETEIPADLFEKQGDIME